MFLPQLRAALSQGDVFKDIRINEIVGGVDGAVSVVLLSHDCEFEKKVEHALVVRVFSADAVQAGIWGDIRRGRVLNDVYLPKVGNRPEGFVNFRYIQRVPKADLITASDAGRRVLSMTDDGRQALVAYLYRFLTRSLPPKPRFGKLGWTLLDLLGWLNRLLVPKG